MIMGAHTIMDKNQFPLYVNVGSLSILIIKAFVEKIFAHVYSLYTNMIHLGEHDMKRR